MTIAACAGWDDPIPLDERQLPEWPGGIFPGPFDAFVTELSRSTETPIELAALTMLSSVAAVVQGSHIIRVREDYSEPLNIWTIVALPPGSRKSAVQSACVAPLVEWEREKGEDIAPQRRQYESRARCLEERLKELRKKAAKTKGHEYAALEREVAGLEASLGEPPRAPQLWTSDVTPENLGVIMADNEERMAILSDEGGGMLDILNGRYSNGIPNLDLALQSHSGNPCRVNRGSRPPVFLNKPCLTIGLTPQPSVLEGLTSNRAFRGRGLVGRFLYAVPKSNLGYRTLNEPPMSNLARDEYRSEMSRLLELRESAQGSAPKVLRLDSDACVDWNAFGQVVEHRLGEGQPYAEMPDWAGKAPGAVIRIAGLLHLMKGKSDDQPIERDTMQKAVKMGFCLAAHALAAFDLMGRDYLRIGARRVVGWLRRNPCSEFSQRDAHRALRSYFDKVAKLKPCLELLEEMGYIRPKEVGKAAHRPSLLYEVNPQLSQSHHADPRDGKQAP